MFPGEVFRFYVTSEGPDARVVELRLFDFLNELNSELSISFIDANYNDTNRQRSKLYVGDIYRIETIAYATLYATRKVGDTSVDVSVGVPSLLERLS